MNRNQIIGTIIGQVLGYAVQGFLFAKIVKVTNPKTVILLKTGAKYSFKIVKCATRKYVRTDFSPETIFSDAIDASFFAD